MVSPAQRAQFDRLLDAVVDELPDELHGLLEQVPLIVEDEPSPKLLAELGMAADEDLCGLHDGIMLTERSVDDVLDAPEQIMLFRGPVMRLAGDGSEQLACQRLETLEHEIRVTVLHEIGHHFGLDESDLARLGYD